MRDRTLLVIDDDPLVIESIRLALPDRWRVLAARQPHPLPDRGFRVALVDLHLSARPGAREGLEVIRRLHRRDPSIEIIAMSGLLDRALMDECLMAGATRFLAKPLNLAELCLQLDKIEAFVRLLDRGQRGGAAPWIGSGQTSRRVLREIAQLRGEGGPILIEGESGTGKEVCAQLINAQEIKRPLVTINVASIPETLFESELFGHVKGAFTGADQDKMGLIEMAAGGDLFLDEIEALDPAPQAKLLRFLESGEIRRVGGRNTTNVDVRVIAASNQDLARWAAEGKFREDLRWRLAARSITLPPLRDRPDDLPELIQYFLEADPVRRKDIEGPALNLMRGHHWPGNVRELKRTCEHLLLTAPLPIIRTEDVAHVLRPLAALDDDRAVDLTRGLAQLVGHYEGRLIRGALAAQKDIDDVARTLKISRSSLYKKIKDHQLAIGTRR